MQGVSGPLRDAQIEDYCYMFLSDVSGAYKRAGEVSGGPLASQVILTGTVV